MMLTLVSIVSSFLAVVVAVPVAVFVVEIIAATFVSKRRHSASPVEGVRGPIAVLVPAHNESSGILPTLSDIKAQLRPSDRLVVVADNCDDDTADVAAAAGAEVVSREDLDRLGKGYALDFGLRYLATAAPPAVVVVVDADCRLADNALEHLVRTCMSTHCPTQAFYVMSAPDGAMRDYRVAEFAWRIKNLARPLGLQVLGLPCLLTGTGMAFPWDVFRSVNLASGSIVEDMKLGLDLALAGKSPVLCRDAKVVSHFPSSVEGTLTQRRRWETGHIDIILTMVPRLVLAGFVRANPKMLALALDVAVPPLSLLAVLIVGVLMVAILATLIGASSVALFVSLSTLAAFASGVCLAWWNCGRDILRPSAMLSIMPYALAKLPLYGRIFSRTSGRQWIRTDRQKM